MDKKRKEYLDMLEVFMACLQAIHGKPIPVGQEWRADIQPLAFKIFFHLGTVYHLQEGTSLPAMLGVKPEYVDFPSVATVARSAFETFLAAHYIFFQPDNDEERAFRHSIWKLGGLFDRQKFLVARSAEAKSKLAEEKAIIDNLRESIFQHPLLKRLPVEHQKEAIKGKWRLKYHWEDLAELADQHKGFFISIYALVCAHAHGSYLSVLQISQAEKQEDQRSLTGMYTHIGLLLMAHFLKNYCVFIKEAQLVLDQNEKYARLVEANYITASDMDSFYRNLSDSDFEE